MKIISFVLFLSVALGVNAEASTVKYRINVTGSADLILFGGVFSNDDGDLGTFQITDLSEFVPRPRYDLTWFASGRGFAEMTAQPIAGQQEVEFNNCSGMLVRLCNGSNQLGNLTTGRFVAFVPGVYGTILTPFEFVHANDDTFSFSYFGQDYFVSNGVFLQSQLDSYSISLVPLPASWTFLLALVTAGFLMARRRQINAA
jgi:hypothetical protein